MPCRINGRGSAPIDLYTLVATAFIDSKVLAFHHKYTFLHDMVDSNPKALSAYEIIRTLKTKFRFLEALLMWTTFERNKVYTEGDPDGLKLSMNKMVESHKRGNAGGNGRSQDGKARDLSIIDYF